MITVLNKYEPFSDTETTALLFPLLAEEHYPRIPLPVSYHQDMEIATLIWFLFEHPIKKIKTSKLKKKNFWSVKNKISGKKPTMQSIQLFKRAFKKKKDYYHFSHS